MRAALHDLDPGALVIVACSGGPDSLALTAATTFEARRTGVRVGAVIVDHGLHPESGRVAETAAGQCRRLGADPVLVCAVHVDRAGEGPEAAARTARYGALHRAAAEYGAEAVFLGHTLDDQAEQVLLGLARGSGARSLAAMPARRGMFVRPLLGVPRALVHRAAAEEQLIAWTDPANADPAFTRSRVRSRVMPLLEDELGPGVAAALARTADQLREDAEVLDALAVRLLAAARQGQPSGGSDGLPVDVLSCEPAAVRRRALHRWLLDAGCPGAALARRHVLAVDALLTGWHGQGRIDLPGGVGVVRRSGRLVADRPAAAGPARSALAHS